MSFKTIFFLALGFGLMSLSNSLELRGDLAPFVKDGVSTERLQYHLMALVVLLGALGCFIYAGIRIFRRIRNGY
jgi:hypothetical protein